MLQQDIAVCEHVIAVRDCIETRAKQLSARSPSKTEYWSRIVVRAERGEDKITVFIVGQIYPSGMPYTEEKITENVTHQVYYPIGYFTDFLNFTDLEKNRLY